ncbi:MULTISPECIES: ATP-dependent DNA ligase [Methanosphaera]|uniref:DNA ligase n=2 Tax=Methanosphaera stadtmanae TaxID=2317 RepID=DNLI_METST|nr:MULTISPECIES: ATP-dependent DNA ligase [Methanosphaera]Q2NHF9.1 RecName: Full=DNA ligase; AltName: Full=Polydeoxyribonucleotide synthase [ATP] [Methanosphaera stadtmanae DSM 3091]ABC56674.1 ATP-dependent DNA ligase [Methanosphaera stadtmanae DSM 3091]MEE0490065.1 ATP-dependent DNA ligase [Methanosphaera stadtmanae]OEC85956.1 DNA ligase [Methanosphaera sp. A6]RAP03629.1 DNA ligase [Methanosphaera stadtmanae]RAP48449.1 MAG: DNA ligase [Methanosphaera sp. DEW79]
MTNTSYEKLVEVYEKISSTSSRLEKQDIIADFLMYIKETDADITYDITLLLQGKIFPPWSDKEMGISTQLIIKALSNLLGESTKSIENKLAEVGDMGEISEELIKNNKQVTFFKVPLTVKKVLSNLRKTESITGSKSQNKKINYLLELYTSASPLEAKYITRTITERLRIGVGEGTLVEAIAQAYNIDKEIIDRAYMLSNDLGEVASRAQESIESVKSLTITPGKPIKPMLAQLSPGIKESITEMKKVICETKYDGIRVQIHHYNNKTKIFTRRLENVTNALPEVVEYIEEALPSKDFIVEGEVIATKDNKPISFQYILQRVKRKYDIDKMREKIPLKVFLFDVLYYDKPTAELPIIQRRQLLEEIVTTSKNVELSTMKIVSQENYTEAEKLFTWSIDEGHEGIMFKDVTSPYSPGKRGKNMLKYKPLRETLDCVITGGTYGKGKRAKFFGSYLLSLLDEKTGEYKTLVHAATGMDDDLLASLTKRMEKLIISKSEQNVLFKPKVILEIAYSEIVESNEYESGYSLRFPAIKGVRDDIGLDEVDTLSKLHQMIDLQK